MKKYSGPEGLTLFWTILIVIGLLTTGGLLCQADDSEDNPKSRLELLYQNDIPATVAVPPGRPEGIQLLDALILSDKPGHASGWLAVRIRMAPDWHIYPDEEQLGASPTRILVNPETIPLGYRVGGFRPVSPISREDLLGSPLQVMKEEAVWLAPITRDPAAPDGGVPLDQVTISGTVSALACSEGEGGVCFPFEDTWTASPGRISREDSYINKYNSLGQASSDSDGEIVHGNKGTFSWTILFYALAGGLILNVMPCVLPVIGLKIISFFRQAGQSRRRAFLLNVWYTVGILLVFTALAAMSVGLSFLFTYGLFQIMMGAIVFVMALSLMGIWELTLPAFLGGKKSSELMEREGPVAAIFKGVITTLLAIPCGAPLLSPALVWSDSMIQQGQSLLVLPVYLIIGLGMASPYLILGAFPELLRFLPKPGQWMETFRVVMGFILLPAVVWILYSMPVELVLPMVALLFSLWFVCWLIGRVEFTGTKKQQRRAWVIGLTVLLVTVVFSFDIPHLQHEWTLQSAFKSKLIRWGIRAERQGEFQQDDWLLFNAGLLKTSLEQGKPVLVDFTADWCMNCKVLEATVLRAPEVQALEDSLGFVTMTADWTNQNDDSDEIREMNRLLDAHGGRQVPVVMIFDPRFPDDPIVLRGVFGKSRLMEALKQLE